MGKEIFPPMHTAQHLLNQAMVSQFACGRSFRDHIEKKKSKLDYHFNRNLSNEEIVKIESIANDIVRKNLEVFEEYVDIGEAKRKYNLDRLNGEFGEKIRIIKIGDFDDAPCKGLHVKSTKEIGTIKIISSDWDDGVLRIRYKLSQ